MTGWNANTLDHRQATQEQTEDASGNSKGQGCQEEEGIDNELLPTGCFWEKYAFGVAGMVFLWNCTHGILHAICTALGPMYSRFMILLR